MKSDLWPFCDITRSYFFIVYRLKKCKIRRKKLQLQIWLCVFVTSVKKLIGSEVLECTGHRLEWILARWMCVISVVKSHPPSCHARLLFQ